MLEIPEEIKELFRSDNLTKQTAKKFKLTFWNDKIEVLYPYETLFPSEDLFPSEHEGEPWLVIENDRIETESLTITESLSESEDLEFGSCESTMFEVIVADVAQDVTGREFVLTVEIDGYELAMGIYTVESFVRQADRRKRKITAYDRMRWFNVDVSNWYNDLFFPMTLGTFRNSLCSHIGIQQSGESLLFDSLEISKTIEPQQISGLDILKAICQLNGCFGHVDKTGQLIYIHLQQTGLYPSEDLYPSEELYPSELGADGKPFEIVSKYKNLTYEDYVVDSITGLTIRQEDGDIGSNVGEGDNPYIIEGNFLVYGKSAVDLLSIATNLLNYVSGRVYRPANLDCIGMPWVEVGDGMRIITRDDIVETFVMKRITTGCQSMRDQVESTGSPKREEVFGINKQIIQLEGKTAVIIKNVEEVSVRLTDLKAQEEAHFEITSNRITAEVKRAQEAEAELKIEADRISLDVTNFKKDTNARFEITDEAIKTKVTKGTISSEISQEAGKITLSANRLIVNSTNFTLDGNGNATFSGNVTGANITGSTITGNVISGGTINGTTITGGTITGTSIYGGTNIRFQARPGVIQVGDFYVDDEYGRQIFQSEDECTGMSTGDVPTGRWYLWAGYGKSSYGTAVFLVSRNQVRIYGDLYINDKNIMTLINSGGSGGCTSDCDNYGSGCSCDDKVSCAYEGCVGLTCGPGDV